MPPVATPESMMATPAVAPVSEAVDTSNAPTLSPKKKKSPVLAIAGAALLAGGTAAAFGAKAQEGVMDRAEEGDIDAVEDAWDRQQRLGYAAYGMWGLGALGLGAHFVF